MGKDIVQAGSLHVLQKRYHWRVFLYEYPRGEYLWLYAWLSSSLRGNGIYPLIKRAVFYRTPGLHHLHFYPSMRTVRQISQQMKWKYIGKSKLFEECVEYRYQVERASLEPSELQLEHIVKPYSGQFARRIPILGLREVLSDYITEREKSCKNGEKKYIAGNKLFSKCSDCGHLCCKYITVKIHSPRTIRDFDGLFWQLSHDNVKAYKDSTGWYLLIKNACLHLRENDKCAIYNNRPITCREHSMEKCEYGNPISKASKNFFDDCQSLNRFCEKKFRTWHKRF